MAVEIIKCEACGSSEVTEFKPGSYVCGHCEAVFKYVRPAGGSAAGCEIDACGVTSVGRCYHCGRAFCSTHQALDPKTKYVDWCTACQADKKHKEAEAARARWDAQRTEVDRILQVADPVERYLRALAYCDRKAEAETPHQSQWTYSALPPGHRATIVADRRRSDFEASFSGLIVDSVAIAAWFRERAPQVKPDRDLTRCSVTVVTRVPRRTLFGKPKMDRRLPIARPEYRETRSAPVPAWHLGGQYLLDDDRVLDAAGRTEEEIRAGVHLAAAVPAELNISARLAIGRCCGLATPLSEVPRGRPAGVPDEIIDLAHAGKTLEAIKRYRTLTGATLHEARAFVAKL